MKYVFFRIYWNLLYNPILYTRLYIQQRIYYGLYICDVVYRFNMEWLFVCKNTMDTLFNYMYINWKFIKELYKYILFILFVLVLYLFIYKLNICQYWYIYILSSFINYMWFIEKSLLYNIIMYFAQQIYYCYYFSIIYNNERVDYSRIILYSFIHICIVIETI